MTGTLPESIGNFKDITMVHMKGSIYGTLPDSIEKWISCIYITVEYSSISGTIPSSICNWNHNNLQWFDLTNVNINGTFPSCIFENNFSSLSAITIVETLLNGIIPLSISNLNNLTQINIRNNAYLTGTVPTICPGILRYFEISNIR